MIMILYKAALSFESVVEIQSETKHGLQTADGTDHGLEIKRGLGVE